MQKTRKLAGMIKRHPDGFGFFIPDDKEHPDVYIPHAPMRGIMTGDRVEVEAFPERNSDRFRGEVTAILERKTKRVVGRFFKLNETNGLIRDEGKGWGEDLKVKIADSMNAKDKELVVAEILTYPGEKSFTGKIVEIIGDAADPLNDIRRVLAAQNIPVPFSQAALDEAKTFGEAPEEKDFKGRKDLRALDLITIDGATAKDFDDAVYVETNNTGFLLYVAIADVSHYVRVGSAIDKDAYERGTSVYFPNYVVPMLPEVLSNGLCSLNPHVPRLCVVAEMQFDYNGEMQHSNFYEAVMESKARVTYGQAQEIIDGGTIEKFDHVRESILRLADLAKILMAKRFKDGSLDLEIPETEIMIDASGVPIDIIKSERLFAHRLIEEMMLAANVAVAKFLSKREVPALYRIHEPPNEIAIKLLERYLRNFGGKVTLNDGKLQKRLTRALQEFEGKPEAQILNILALRSMSQAKYHMDNVGHFGLGFDFYSHFTSPIRRYPDLIVHRLLKTQVMQNSPYQQMSEDELLSAGTMLSAAEQRSTKAERQIKSIKKARFMEQFVGKEFDGIISSVTKFGVFVLLREYDVDGLIRLDDLGGEKWEFDEDNLRLVGKRSGFAYSIGDQVRVLVTAADPEEGQINFGLPESIEKMARREKFEGKKHASRSRADKAALREAPRHGSKKQRERNEDESAHHKARNEERNERNRGNRGREQDRDRDRNRPKKGKKAKGQKSFIPGKRTIPGLEASKSASTSAPAKNERLAFGKAKNDRRKGDRRGGSGSDRRQSEAPQGRAGRGISSLKPDFSTGRQDEGPNKQLMEMIMGPEASRKAIAEIESKPKLSRKLQAAESTRLEPKEKDGVTSEGGNSNRKNSQERGSTARDSGGVRKARVSQRRGKGKAR